MTKLSIIIPANNEEDYIGACLRALLNSELPNLQDVNTPCSPPVEIIVIANGCSDDTVAASLRHREVAQARGWCLDVINLSEGNKLAALDAGDRTATGDILIYVDADVVVSPQLLADTRAALDRPEARYAGGRPAARKAQSWITQAYARFWLRLPFITECVPGCGVFAVNRSGRRRWESFPRIISDDTFVRLSFTPAERIGVPAAYAFPLPEGFARLVRVRRRQNRGVSEIAERYPELLHNDDKPALGLQRLARLVSTDPVGFVVYGLISLAVKLSRPEPTAWSRGR
jgi:glycosyltransferase involved in cell wall biosynthesis